MHDADYGKQVRFSWVRTMYQIFLICLLPVAGCQAPQGVQIVGEKGFASLFDGQSLKGWTLLNPIGSGYSVTNLVENASTNAVIYCVKGGGGNLMSEKQYDDFILRFDFKLTQGAKNGLAIRAPMQAGSLAFDGIELQILDNSGAKARHKKKLRPEQFHGAGYDVIAPARRKAQKPVGQWNTQEVTAIGRKLTVKVNGKIIINADLNSVKDPAVLLKHPGILRSSGHIGFLGHNDEVYFRNIRIKELSRVELDNKTPAGFRALFNGRSLAGWRGVLAAPNNNPIRRAKLKDDQLVVAQAKADETMLAHWRVIDGGLVFDGKGKSLSTGRHDYGNYELLLDWKIGPKGDSGVYLRGTPQVQIWDPRTDDHPKAALGSGGLYNNKISISDPLVKADYFTGSWNRFRILMIESRAHVFLNGQLVVKNTPLENYWDREQPIFPSGPIVLQAHGNPLWFKNIYIREIR
jgi:hypothetical protein